MAYASLVISPAVLVQARAALLVSHVVIKQVSMFSMRAAATILTNTWTITATVSLVTTPAPLVLLEETKTVTAANQMLSLTVEDAFVITVTTLTSTETAPSVIQHAPPAQMDQLQDV